MKALPLLLLWLSPAGQSAEPVAQAALPPAVLTEALDAFDEGSRLGASDPDAARRAYERARRQFESLVSAGVNNGYLLYNLGNTYLRLGQLGRAIIQYRRAERLIPADDRVAENLRFARSLRSDQVQTAAGSAALRQLLFWHYGTPLRTRATVALAAYIGFWLFAGAGLWWRQRPSLRWASRICAVVAIVLAVSVGAELRQRGSVTEGVLVADDVVIRKGNGETYEPVFEREFSEGLEFVVIERRDNWLQIELPDGRTGWIRRDQAELI